MLLSVRGESLFNGRCIIFDLLFRKCRISDQGTKIINSREFLCYKGIWEIVVEEVLLEILIYLFFVFFMEGGEPRAGQSTVSVMLPTAALLSCTASTFNSAMFKIAFETASVVCDVHTSMNHRL